MNKRILALVLSLVLLMSVLPLQAFAATEEQKICQTISDDYYSALADSGKESLKGSCGLLASYQLYYRGINSWLRTANGNDHYDIYIEDTLTTGGYSHRDYSGVNFSMEEALNFATRNGTQDVYNALVCFQQTSTEAGQLYGHVVFVYAILDGIVYFAESFAMGGYAEGMPIAYTIEEFVDFYDDWTTFEGLVVFGKKDYIDNCTAYSTNLFVEVTEEATLTSEPCNARSTEVACLELRQVVAGERLHATGLYQSTSGKYYYRIADGTQVGYVPAEQVVVVRANFEDVALADPVVPEALAIGEDFQIDGDVSAIYSGVNAVSVEVLNESGEMVLGYSQTMLGTACNLDEGGFNSLLNFASLPKGYYTYAIYTESVNHYLMDDGTVFDYKDHKCLLTTEFRVGNLPVRAKPAEAVQMETIRDGWSYVDNSWYYYENGAPRTGWFYHNGVDYYLQEDGAVTTGWVEINGKMRYFTSTGTMRTGWVITKEGPVYLLSNGAMAQGWISLEGKRCWFNENGTQGQGWLTYEGKQYYLDTTGHPVSGWITVPEGTLCFHQDGYLIAQQIEENGVPKVVPVQTVTLKAE